jgi:acetyltransferase-like isoleucine patch superfamily enzyme
LQQVHIGANSRISEHSWISCIEEYAGEKFTPLLTIGENTSIGRFGHIIACGKMRIGNQVAIAERVYITDNIHGYEKIGQHIMAQPLKHSGPVTIEDGVWIGDGACILPGVTIGRDSVIGSNSVVTKDIPERSVVAGVPAKVIKKFNRVKNAWERI